MAAFLGMTAIILGAFGAHALKKVLPIEQLNTFEVGVKYQMYHALFLLFIGFTDAIQESLKQKVFWFTSLGVFLFSGSIYLLATDSLNEINFKTIGFVTPIGGLLLIVSWGMLLFHFLTKKV
jgi:uncharacterized membrane protein YgdD (TMEM256/DUF423 family)